MSNFYFRFLLFVCLGYYLVKDKFRKEGVYVDVKIGGVVVSIFFLALVEGGSD